MPNFKFVLSMLQLPKYKVERPVYSLEDLSQNYSEKIVKSGLCRPLNFMKRVKKLTIWSMMNSIFPWPFIMTSFYSWKYILCDVFAGFTLLSFHISQGMTCGLLAGLQPINGLYASFIPVIIYCFFGSSRHLSMGTVAIMAVLSSNPLIREGLLKPNDLNNQTSNKSSLDLQLRLKLYVSTTLFSGIIQLMMGLLQMGFIIKYINESLISGFLTALCFHIILSQIEDIFGYSIPIYNGFGEFPYKIYLYAIGLTNVHWIPFGIFCCCFLVLLLFTEIIGPELKKYCDLPLPIPLLLIIIFSFLSYYFSFSLQNSVKVVGNIPLRLLQPILPDPSLWPKLIGDGLFIGFFGFIFNCIIVKNYSLEFDYKVNYNQEVVACGISNIVGAFLQCTIASASFDRTAVAVETGMKSQFASFISGFMMLLFILFIGPIFDHLPRSVLSAIIVVSLKSTILRLKEIPDIFRTSKYDFDIWIVTFVCTLVLTIPFGFVVGFSFSILTIFMRFHHPTYEILGQLPNTDIYENIKGYRQAAEIQGIKIFRCNAPIFFANVKYFEDKFVKKCGVNFQKTSSSKNEEDIFKLSDKSLQLEKTHLLKVQENDLDWSIKTIIVDLVSVSYVDHDAVRILLNILDNLQNIGISLYFVEPNPSTRKIFAKFSNFHDDKIFVSIHDAVLTAQSKRLTGP